MPCLDSIGAGGDKRDTQSFHAVGGMKQPRKCRDEKTDDDECEPTVRHMWCSHKSLSHNRGAPAFGDAQFGERCAIALDGRRFEVWNFAAGVVIDVDFVRRAVTPAEQAAAVSQDAFLADDVALVQFHRRDGIHVLCDRFILRGNLHVAIPVRDATVIKRPDHVAVGVLLATLGQMVAERDGRVEMRARAVADAAGLAEARELQARDGPGARLAVGNERAARHDLLDERNAPRLREESDGRFELPDFHCRRVNVRRATVPRFAVVKGVGAVFEFVPINTVGLDVVEDDVHVAADGSPVGVVRRGEKEAASCFSVVGVRTVAAEHTRVREFLCCVFLGVDKAMKVDARLRVRREPANTLDPAFVTVVRHLLKGDAVCVAPLIPRGRKPGADQIGVLETNELSELVVGPHVGQFPRSEKSETIWDGEIHVAQPTPGVDKIKVLRPRHGHDGPLRRVRLAGLEDKLVVRETDHAVGGVVGDVNLKLVVQRQQTESSLLRDAERRWVGSIGGCADESRG